MMMEGGGEEGGEEYLFKLVIIGDSAVGKSNLMLRYVRNEFHLQSKATIGVEFHTQSMEFPSTTAVGAPKREVKAQIWDTAGQERFRAVTSAYYRGTSGALIVYDITRRKTFQNVRRWLEELRTHSERSVVTMLVGNKCDLEDKREVSAEEGKAFAEAEKLFFMETSALAATNVNIAFQTVVKDIYDAANRKVLSSNSLRLDMLVSRSRRIILSANNGSTSNGTKPDERKSSCCA